MTMLSVISRSSLVAIFIFFNGNSAKAGDLASSKYVDMTKGSNTAPVTLIEYASFTCPHCADFHRNVFPLVDKEFIATGKVRFIYREVYFDAPGLWAGLLARCIEKDKYFGIINLLFDKQKIWSSGGNSEEILSELLSIGRQVGISDEQTLACMKDEEKALDLVEAFQTNSKNDNITSTPSLILNGKLLKNIPFEELKKEIEKVLK